MPLLTWIVMIEPGMVCPDGEVPTTVSGRRGAVDRLRPVGDLETGVPQTLAGQVQVHAGDARHPGARAAVDVARIRRRQHHGVRW